MATATGDLRNLVAFIRGNATSAAAYFKLPTDRVIEISTQVEL